MSRMPFADTLALHEDFVRGLARGVLGLDGRVEDIVQDTWRIALEKAPRERSRLRRWLAVVVRNRAISLLRKDASRRKYESAVRPGAPAPAAVEIAAREETRRRLVEAMLGLPKPYREALLLRYYEALGPKAIARRLGLPRNTVKTRLRRGLQRLRDELGGGRSLLALTPLAFARRSLAAALGGVLIVKTQLKVALVLVFAVTAFFGWRLSGGWTPSRAEQEHLARTPLANGNEGGVVPTDEGAEETRSRRPATVVDARRLLRGELVAEGVRVRGIAKMEARGVRELGLSDKSMLVESTRDGVFELDVAPLLDGTARQIALKIDHPRYMPREALVSLRADGKLEHTIIELAPAAVVEGVVLRPDGTSAAQAEVAVYVREGSSARAVDYAKVNTDGRYRLRVGADGSYWLAASEVKLRPAARHEELRVRQVRSALPLRLREGVTISGRLLVNGNPPPAGTFVKANYRGSGLWGRNVVLHDDGTEVGDVRARVGPDGRFVCEGLAPAKYSIRCVGLRKSHMSVYQGRRVLAIAPTSGVEVRIERAELVIEVTGAGVPRERATVWVHGQGTHTAHTDAQGRFTTHVRPRLEYTIEVKVKGFDDHTEKVVVDRAGDRRVVSIALTKQQPRATLVVRVVASEPPETIALGLFREASTRIWPRIRRSAKREAGVYRVDDLASGTYRVVVRDGEDFLSALGYHLDVEARVVLSPGAESVIDVELRVGGRLRLAAKSPDGRYVQAPCDLRNADGKKIAAIFVTRSKGGFSSSQNTLSMGGPSEIGRALPAGRYTATISASGFVRQKIELTIEKGRTTVRKVVLEPK